MGIKGVSRTTIVLSVALSAIIIASALISVVYGASQDSGADPSELSSSYIIFKEGSSTVARNGTSGAIDFRSDNSSFVFQRVVDQVKSTGGLIHVKPGIYLMTAQVNITSRCVIQGEGYSNIDTGTILRAVNNITMFNVYSMGEWGFGMRSIMLDGDNKGNIGIKVDFLNRANFYDVMVYDWKEWGVVLSNATALNFNGCKFMKNGAISAATGGVLLGDPGYAFAITFDSCQFDWCGVGAILRMVTTVTFRSCIIENCLYSGIRGQSDASEGWWAQQVYFLESYFEENNVIGSSHRRDISIEGPHCGYWTISNCIFIGFKVNHSIAADWMTGPINIENPRIYGSPIYYIAESGYLLGVEARDLDPSCLPLRPGVTGLSSELFGNEDHGHLIIPANQTIAYINHSLGSKPSAVILTSGTGGGAVNAWVDETETDRGRIAVCLPKPSETPVSLYWVAYR